MKEKLLASYGRMTEGMLGGMQGNYTAFKIMFCFGFVTTYLPFRKQRG